MALSRFLRWYLTHWWEILSDIRFNLQEVDFPIFVVLHKVGCKLSQKATFGLEHLIIEQANQFLRLEGYLSERFSRLVYLLRC